MRDTLSGESNGSIDGIELKLCSDPNLIDSVCGGRSSERDLTGGITIQLEGNIINKLR